MRSRAPEPTRAEMLGWAAFKRRMIGKPLLAVVRINKGHVVKALADIGCDLYALVSESLVERLRLPLVDRRAFRLRAFSEDTTEVTASGVAVFTMEVSGHEEKVYAYVVPGLDHDVFLGNPWFEHNQVIYNAKKRRLYHGRGDVRIYLNGQPEPPRVREVREGRLVSGSTFAAICRRVRRGAGKAEVLIRAVSLADIEAALRPKEPVDPAEYVPEEFLREFPNLFSPRAAKELPPHRPGIDHEINLVRGPNGEEPPLPWGPLYSMSREELLVLRKTLKDLLDQGFIQTSSSAAAAPVLFVRKPGGGLRFCCDYRALNAITKKDRYPLPLITETLRNLAGATLLTKLDVTAAFHKIRMAKGHEEKTAFRTRYGLFEWTVCPFGLCGAPATFQRYINHVLRRYLDIFVTAYMDDVLIYTHGSRKDHNAKVRLVLRALDAAGLTLDPKKCEFGVKQVKYLGFIVTAGEGISCDPEKVRALREWLPPTTVKGVRSFLGFANYYRIFIRHFSEIVRPLTALTKKGVAFRWGKEEEDAFQTLKEHFTNAPVLRHFDYRRPTMVETDSSGYALGGILTQEDENANRYVVAYHSQRLTPEEYNYEIHDKEMLAIIRCLEAWRGELKSCGRFTILTDHRNLKYFMTRQRLTERQSRWAGELAEFDFQLQYRPGSLNGAADALSRREQDKPRDFDDEREQGRFIQLIPESALQHASVARVSRTRHGTTVGPPITQVPEEDSDGQNDEATAEQHGRTISEAAPTPAPSTSENEPTWPPRMQVFEEDQELQQAWDEALAADMVYRQAFEAVKGGAPSFPPELKLKVQINECTLDAKGRLTFRDRLWVPSAGDTCPLRGRLIQRIHDSTAVGHPGRDGTVAMMVRQFYWPGLPRDVRRFVRNCDVCGRSHIWRQAKRGLLKPLPIPQRLWSDIAMDFITDLPPSGKDNNRYLLVITDRLGKGVILEAMPSMDAEACAQRMLHCFVRFHGLPRSIVSDRGSNWTSRFWKKLCELVGIQQRLSTAYHPQTDGGPERLNQEIEAYLRAFTCYLQSDWANLLPLAQLALLNRHHSSIQMSPFFLQHGYHVDPIKIVEDVTPPRNQPEVNAKALVQRWQDVTEMAQAAMAAAQQRYEEAANKKRVPAERFRVGDKVWLHVGNYSSPRPSKKLDWLHHKYTVTKVIGSHVVELDVPRAIYPRFHVDLLRRAATDPLPGQVTDDIQPPPIRSEEGDDMYDVEGILCARWKRKGRGRIRQCLVKWVGYAQPTWEPLEALMNTEALAEFEAKYGSARRNDGPLSAYEAPEERRRS